MRAGCVALNSLDEMFQHAKGALRALLSACGLVRGPSRELMLTATVMHKLAAAAHGERP